MLQAVMTAPGKIEFRQVEPPTPGANDVIVQIQKIGVCGSDIHVFHGLHPYTSYPVVQGHEVAGRVSAVGANVTDVKIGDDVTFMPQVTCGECFPCRHGMYHICDNLKVMGFQTGGAAQEYFAVPANMIIKLPPNMSYEIGAMIEPVSVAVHALSRAQENLTGKKVLVLGAGPIGNLVGQVAKGMGAAAVMIVDFSDFRLEKARECGIDFAINPKQDDLSRAILRDFGADKADLILECIGVEPTMTEAIRCARKGTKIIVVGVFGEKPHVDLGLVQDRELSLIGTLMYQKKDYEQAIALAEAGKLRLESLVTDRFPFQSYLEAYHYIETRKDRAMKVMINVAG
ncbi:zinc-containing alcohol dehydrogenase [Candidatus Moduliflexus flocculans]|uniref:Zinc-containing alcohol dehydrogenase n=1 Tax=Candidatus Moduliflexus flocculans TaxID=1499966 RepID=A0A0S6VUG2_9BACT|nr:zinc-containing alcohol dehydrogenase [Candidatus Moduliflexus flocculans]